MDVRPPLPPFTRETAIEKVRQAEDAWNTRDPIAWRSPTPKTAGGATEPSSSSAATAIVAFLAGKWARELDYRLVKELWAFTDDRIAVRFQYECHDDRGHWYRARQRAVGVRRRGLMRRREASINDVPILEAERKFRWRAGSPAGGPPRAHGAGPLSASDRHAFRTATCARRFSSRARIPGRHGITEILRLEQGTISTSVPSNGARLSHSTASSIDLTCQSQNPATSSFASVKGPSMTVRFAPENRTRFAFEVGWSPSPATRTPAFASSSLNFVMSASSFSSGRAPASEFASAFTSTMTRIVVSPCRGLDRPISPVRRTTSTGIDTGRIFFSRAGTMPARTAVLRGMDPGLHGGARWT